MSDRINALLKAKEFIREYIEMNLEELLKLRNGAVIIQTVCEDLGIIDMPSLVEVANTVWMEEFAKKEIDRQSRKETLQKDVSVPEKVSSALPTIETVSPRLVELFRQQQQDHEEIVEIFGDAIEHIIDRFNRPQPTFFQRIKALLGGKSDVPKHKTKAKK